jgi:hypothetical protein
LFLNVTNESAGSPFAVGSGVLWLSHSRSGRAGAGLLQLTRRL